MDASLQMRSVNLEIPQSDWTFFKSLAKRMGWKTVEVSGIDKSLDDIKSNHIYHAKNADDLINQILNGDV